MCSILSFAAALVAAAGMTFAAAAQPAQISKPFEGPKANTGTVSHALVGGKHVLTLSDDFKVPDTPDPHWQVVSSKGEVFLLQKLTIKGDKVNRSITLPAYIKDVAKVQIWCSYAEVNLGEAAFASAITTN